MGEAFDHWTYPAATFGIVGVVNARLTLNARITLEAGFTTVHNVSEPSTGSRKPLDDLPVP